MNTSLNHERDIELVESPELGEVQPKSRHLPFSCGVVVALMLVLLPLIGYMFLTNTDDEQSQQVRQNIKATVLLEETPSLETYDRYATFTLDATVPVECRLNDDVYQSCDEEIFLPETMEGSNIFTVRAVADQKQLASHEWEVLNIFDLNTPDLLVSNQNPSKAEPRSWK